MHCLMAESLSTSPRTPLRDAQRAHRPEVPLGMPIRVLRRAALPPYVRGTLRTYVQRQPHVRTYGSLSPNEMPVRTRKAHGIHHTPADGRRANRDQRETGDNLGSRIPYAFMPDASKPNIPSAYQRSANSVVEEILNLRHPWLVLAQGIYDIARVMRENVPVPDNLVAVEQERHSLLALSPEELQGVLEQELAKKEAAQFYNYAIGPTELAHWALLDAWTREESVALLLGRDPGCVSLSTIKHRQGVSRFVQAYQRLLQIVERAAPLQGGERLDPVAVLTWGLARGLNPPARLVELVEQRTGRSTRPETTAAAAPKAPAEAEIGGTTKRWTEERLQELRAHHAMHGAKQTAEKFGITRQRVQELVKKAAEAEMPVNSVFNQKRR